MSYLSCKSNGKDDISYKFKKCFLYNTEKEEDPKAFMFVHETYQALGEGFVPMHRLVRLEEKRRKQHRPNS